MKKILIQIPEPSPRVDFNTGPFLIVHIIENGLKLNVFIVFFQRSIVLQNLQFKKDTSLQAQIQTIQKSKQKNLKNRL